MPGILVVDGNASSSEVMRRTLEAEGYAVAQVTDAATALAWLQREAPDVVIQDLSLPDIDGLELSRRIRLLPNGRTLALVVVSDFVGHLQNARSTCEEYAHVLVKPVTPVKLVAAVRALAPKSRPSYPFRHDVRVLLVDDSPSLREFERRRFEQANFHVITAASAEEALSLIGDANPDVVLSDVLMPDMDGFELCRKIRASEATSHIPVVLVSAYEDEGDSLRASQVGANALVPRGPRPDGVLAAVLEALAAGSAPSADETLPIGKEANSQRLIKKLERSVVTQRAAEHDLKVSESRFHDLVDAVTDYAIFMLDATGHVATWNAGASKNKGYEAHEILGQHFSAFYTPEDRAAGKPEQVLETVRREGRVEDESWRVRKDGTRFWADVVITALRGPNGEITGFAKVTRDLTAKRAIEDELHAAESRFHRLVDAVTDYAIFMLDETGHVATWNVGASRNKGYAAHEIIGQHFSVFYTPEDRAAGKPEQVLETVRRDGRVEDESWRVRKDGTRFWANVVITTLRGADGEITGFAKVTRDLTDKRAAEENERELVRAQLARAAAEASRHEMEQASRWKDEFLATMSHELRTPLHAILGWTAILRQKPREEHKLDRGLDVIERNAKAQARLVSDLIDVSRILNNKLQLQLEKTEIFPLIIAAGDVVRPEADGKGVHWVVDVDPNIGVTLADPDRVQQIVWNLLTNAVRFTPREGRVTLTANRTDSGIEICVRDTGAGIAAEHLPHIFERFKQVDSATTRAHGGLGLGLSIVRHLVEAHGGSVAAHSEGLGRGAEFKVVLPIRAVTSIPADRMLEPSPSIQDVQVLVVDNDQDSLEVLRNVLERAGAHVQTASSAREALETIEAGAPFELIISDIAMPEIDGYAFIRRVRASNSCARVPAIALTAYARASDAEFAKRAGYQEHLAKPVDERELLRAVALLLG